MKRNTFYGVEIETAPPSLRLPLPGATDGASIASLTHPDYDKNRWNWDEWRLTYEGGTDFVNEYLTRFSRRESHNDFVKRRNITPIPAFAAAAVDEIKNSLFERAVDITRKGGPISYTEACKGNNGGMDRKGATMNFFIGNILLPELLVMKKVGVFVDMPSDIGTSLASKRGKQPYIYAYRAEDIRTWSEFADSREYSSVLLRDYKYKLDPRTKLPVGIIQEFRHLHFNVDGFVQMDIYDQGGKFVRGTSSTLQRIPFVNFEINKSLLKNISRYQIALLNLNSSDISYALKSNFPLYVEQQDNRGNAPWLKNSQEGCADDTGDNCDTIESPTKNEIDVGVSHGRAYGKGLDKPGFINPDPDPLRASMEKQEVLEAAIRKLVHLNLSSIQSKMASAESKGFDLQGLEAGLSYLGLELENGERRIAEIWAMYEGESVSTTINYPSRYSLKSQDDVEKETNHLLEVRKSVPSRTFKKEVTKRVATIVLGTTVSSDVHDKILREIDKVKAIPEDISIDLKDNVLSLDSAIEAKGYLPSEKSKAAKDAKIRIARVAAAQSPKGLPPNPAARGLPTEIDPNPQSGKQEKQGKPKRGQGKK